MGYVGCHLSTHGGFMTMGEEALGLGANTFQFFTRNPRGAHAKQWAAADLTDFRTFVKERGFGPLVAYAPYSANPASGTMEEADLARVIYSEDLARLESLPGQFYAAHPGSAVGAKSKSAAVAQVASILNEVLQPTQHSTMLLVTPAGEGNEIAATFEEMAALLDQIDKAHDVGVCFDTACVWGAGYDVADDLDGVLQRFDDAIGLDRLRAVHLADPKYDRGIHHNHHAPLGEGELGWDRLVAIAKHEAIADTVRIWETPHDDIALYAEAIKKVKRA